jgi:hypothetical protein
MRTQAYENILKGHVTIPVSHVKKELAFNTERECISFLKDQKSKIDNILNENDKIEAIIDCKTSLSINAPIISSSGLISSSHQNGKSNIAAVRVMSKKESKAERKKLKNINNMKTTIEKTISFNRNDSDNNVNSGTAGYSNGLGGSGVVGGSGGGGGFTSSSSKSRNISISETSNIVSTNGFTSKSRSILNNTVTSSSTPTNVNIKKIKIDRGPIISTVDIQNNGDGHNRKRKKSDSNSDNNNGKSKKKQNRR